jgi:para-aminobenzoate synthetase
VTDLAATLREHVAASPSTRPVLVALDGRSGTGKSTLAQAVGAEVGALVIDGDDFYRGGDDAYWDAQAPAQKVDLVIDWRRQRAVLQRLRGRRQAQWQPYDWDADDGRLATQVIAGPADVVILDGAYSARAELADLYDLRVLLCVRRDIRQDRLRRREGEQEWAEWQARWGEAEDLYFEKLMPPESFDLVLDGSNGADGGNGPTAATTTESSRQPRSSSTSANVRANVCTSPGQRAET